jgi:hypothetical protein
MVKQSPRIYVYKITFLEVLHYYYGVHKEDTFNEYYMGSPKTNKDFWEFYTPIKEIIKVFPFTDEGWLEANDFEDSLIEPVYNTDPLCLNEHCGGRISLEIRRKTGRRCYELGVGVHARTKEQRIEDGKKAGQKNYELGVGIHALTRKEKSECGKKGYEASLANLSKEEKIENCKKAAKLTNSQVWECTATGHRSNSGALSRYQKARGIDTSNRIRIN